MKSLIDQMKQGVKDMERKSPKPKTKAQEDGPGARLLVELDAHLEQQSKPYFKTRKSFAPSNTIDCARRDVYLFRGIQMNPDINGRTYRIFDNGHAFHERATKYLEDMNILEIAEKEISQDDPPVRGFIDAIINWEGQRIVVEFKSIGEDGFVYRKTFNKPKDDHYMQIQIYLHIEDVEMGYVIYENKNTQEWLLFEIERDREFIEKLFKKWRKTYKIYTDGKLPKRPVKSPDSKKCTYCEVKKWCWEDKEEGI